MIYPQTILTVADNTGAKKVMCIRILGGNKKYAEIGDTIIAVVKEAIPNMPIKRSDVVKAIIVRTKKTIRRQSQISPKRRIGIQASKILRQPRSKTSLSNSPCCLA